MKTKLDDLLEEHKKNNPADEIFMRDRKSTASNMFDKMNSAINWFRLVHNKEPKLIILNSDLFSLCMYELSKTANIDLTEKTLHFKGVEVRPTIKKGFFIDVF